MIFVQNLIRNSHRRCSIKETVLKNFAIFTGKQLCWSLFFDKVEKKHRFYLKEKHLQHRRFPVSVAKLSRTPILKNICERLLLFDHTYLVQQVHTNQNFYVRFYTISLFPLYMPHLFT